MLIYLDIKISQLQIAHQGGNFAVGNIEIHLSMICFVLKLYWDF